MIFLGNMMSFISNITFHIMDLIVVIFFLPLALILFIIYKILIKYDKKNKYRKDLSFIDILLGMII